MVQEEQDFNKMWSDLGMDVAAHNSLLDAVGQMYETVFLTQKNRPKSTTYLDNFANNLHSGRIREMVDARKDGKTKKIIGSFCLYVPEEIVIAAGGIEVGLCAGANWNTDEAERYIPRNTCPLIKGFMGFKLGRVCPYIESADLVVGENTCDGKKKAYEQFSKMKPMYVMDVPHVRNNNTKEIWRQEIYRFAEKMEDETGQKITLESLSRAIKLVNDKRRALQ
ncbi:MAG: 2-hydroxyacyl-CoA dehydratase, partial [Atopobium sp.]|nr:2-hydroxyacyl-CoA dehydratase [Atopobium sp.]